MMTTTTAATPEVKALLDEKVTASARGVAPPSLRPLWLADADRGKWYRLMIWTGADAERLTEVLFGIGLDIATTVQDSVWAARLDAQKGRTLDRIRKEVYGGH